MHNEGDLILALTCHPVTKVMMTIGKDQEPLKARLSLMKKSITRGINAKSRLPGARDTMP